MANTPHLRYMHAGYTSSRFGGDHGLGLKLDPRSSARVNLPGADPPALPEPKFPINPYLPPQNRPDKSKNGASSGRDVVLW